MPGRELNIDVAEEHSYTSPEPKKGTSGRAGRRNRSDSLDGE